VYKGAQFSLRPIDHVIKDIDAVHKFINVLKEYDNPSHPLNARAIKEKSEAVAGKDWQAYNAAWHWYNAGMKSIFLQDANSLIIKPDNLIRVLAHLKNCFPWVERTTSYARSHTIARIKDEHLLAFRKAGLNRIHIGLESGSDKVLKMTKKGIDKATHIKAGRKVKNAGMQLSEYVMPGLGGRDFSREHALETADALNQINPDFIRLRTLAIPSQVELYSKFQAGRFNKCTDVEVAAEILLFIENLDGITSVLKSDHILNLFQNVEGQFPEDKSKMMNILRSFCDMTPEKQCQYQVGRRLGIFHGLEDMNSPQRLRKVEKTCRQLGITPENVDQVVDELMRRFI
jgi:hypothetical protein